MQHVTARVEHAPRMGRGRSSARALLPQSAARLIGFAALATIGALEWERLVANLGGGRALLWVAGAVAAALAVLAAGRAPAGTPRIVALAGAVAVSALVTFAVSGVPLEFLRPRNLGELGAGLTTGLGALGTVRLPYVSADPWPALTLQLLGAGLLVLAALLAFWPRGARRAAEGRMARSGPERGYPFVALAVLLIVVASPVAAVGGTRPLLLGLLLAAVTVCFLWLERLPLRPGIGVAALLAVALAGALPLAVVADRREPWFDYRSFAEGLGPDAGVGFNWAQSYAGINWPREGNEVLRIVSGRAHYWKVRNLDVFDGTTWQPRTRPVNVRRGEEPWAPDVPRDYKDRPEWTNLIAVSIRRMHTLAVPGAGSIIGVSNASRRLRPDVVPGTWSSLNELRRGDSYTLKVYTPDPEPSELAEASSGKRISRLPGELDLTVRAKPHRRTPGGRVDAWSRVHVVHFKGWSDSGRSSVTYPGTGGEHFDVNRVMRRSEYARTWQVARLLKTDAKQPYDYIRNVDRYLRQSSFRYSERPPVAPAGEAPLDYFLNVSHQGYCQHYAGAMALLLRMGGIPARVVTGFSPGGYSSSRKAWVVRDTDAHAWVEVWFDDFGWVTLDPTPDATPARSQVAALPAVQSTPLAPDRIAPGETATDTGADRVPLTVRPELQLGDDPAPSGGGLEPAGVPAAVWGVLLALGLVALALYVALLRRPRGPIAELEDALRRVGRPVSTGTTLHQLERRIGGHSPEAAGYLRALTAGRYAPAPPPPTRAGRRALRRALAQGLGPLGRARALWALPPRVRSRHW